MKSGFETIFLLTFSLDMNILMKIIIEKSGVRRCVPAVTKGFLRCSVVVKDSSHVFKMDKRGSEQANSFHITD